MIMMHSLELSCRSGQGTARRTENRDADVPLRRASHPGRPGSWWASDLSPCLFMCLEDNVPRPAGAPLLARGNGCAGLNVADSLVYRMWMASRISEGLGRGAWIWVTE